MISVFPTTRLVGLDFSEAGDACSVFNQTIVVLNISPIQLLAFVLKRGSTVRVVSIVLGLLIVKLGFFMCHIYWSKVCQLSAL